MVGAGLLGPTAQAPPQTLPKPDEVARPGRQPAPAKGNGISQEGGPRSIAKQRTDPVELLPERQPAASLRQFAQAPETVRNGFVPAMPIEQRTNAQACRLMIERSAHGVAGSKERAVLLDQDRRHVGEGSKPVARNECRFKAARCEHVLDETALAESRRFVEYEGERPDGCEPRRSRDAFGDDRDGGRIEPAAQHDARRDCARHAA